MSRHFLARERKIVHRACLLVTRALTKRSGRAVSSRGRARSRSAHSGTAPRSACHGNLSDQLLTPKSYLGSGGVPPFWRDETNASFRRRANEACSTADCPGSF